MKKYLLFCFFLGIILSAFAQDKYKNLSDKERKALEKEWKSKLKKMAIPEYKQLTEEYNTLRAESGKMSGQIRDLGKQLEEKDKQAMAIRRQIDSIRSLASGRTVATDEDEVDIANNVEFEKGMVFKVQVGVNKKLDGKVFEGEDMTKFAVEKDPDGRLVYTLGYFRQKDEAQNFQKNLAKLGLKDTYIVFYKDGKRANVAEVKTTESSSESDW